MYRALTYFDPPLTYFDPPIISLIGNEFALSEKYVEFWCTNLQLTAESSHYLMWLKSLCSWIKERQRWIKVRQSTVYQYLVQKMTIIARKIAQIVEIVYVIAIFLPKAKFAK